jgi:hypothetical protein
MPVDGAVEVRGSGFEIQIRSVKEQAVPVSDVNSEALTNRERFTFAHEISHTFFYDAQFRPIPSKPRKQLLEALCNMGAACLLLPQFLVEKQLGRGRTVNAIETVLNLAGAAQVSTTVAIKRLDEFDHLKEGDYALIAFEPSSEGALQITGLCLSGKFTALPRPALHAEAPAWVQRFAPSVFSGEEGVVRVAYDHKWDCVSRMVPNPLRPRQLLAEIRLDLNAAQ